MEKNDILQSSTTCYKVISYIGKGSFGKVAKCLNMNETEMVAIKIHQINESQHIQHEVEMSEAVNVLDSDKTNIVRFIDYFRFNGLSCLAFEMLDKSLWELMEGRRWVPLSLNEIRAVTHQLLVTLDALKSIGIMHADLKLDNVMLVNHRDQPFKIKLIDFGLALPVSQAADGKVKQNLAFRAPEVTLGLPLSSAVDMWSMGCVMAILFFGYSLFPWNCEYNWMKAMLYLLGQPKDHQLEAGKHSRLYFTPDQFVGWRLRTREEYRLATGAIPLVSRQVFCCNLKEAIQTHPTLNGDIEYRDRMAFLDLLKCCLNLDAEQRIVPQDALRYNFVTMVHMVDELETSSYADAALDFMTVSPLDNLDESDESLTSFYSCRALANDFQEGVRDTASSTKEGSGIYSSDIGPSDGDAASNCPDNRAASTIGPSDADDVRTRPERASRRNLFQMARTVFRRLRERVVSSNLERTT